MTNNHRDELYHYGVLGMKWGVRKNRNGSSGKIRSKRSSINLSEDAKNARDIRKKRVGEMSNAELKKLNERTRLEQEYSRLNQNTIQKGWKYVVGATAVTTTALNLYNNSDKIVNLGKKFIGEG